jgi:hypothetical protein
MEVVNTLSLFFVSMIVLIVAVMYIEKVVDYLYDNSHVLMPILLFIGGDFMLASLVNLVR